MAGNHLSNLSLFLFYELQSLQKIEDSDPHAKAKIRSHSNSINIFGIVPKFLAELACIFPSKIEWLDSKIKDELHNRPKVIHLAVIDNLLQQDSLLFRQSYHFIFDSNI